MDEHTHRFVKVWEGAASQSSGYDWEIQSQCTDCAVIRSERFYL